MSSSSATRGSNSVENNRSLATLQFGKTNLSISLLSRALFLSFFFILSSKTMYRKIIYVLYRFLVAANPKENRRYADSPTRREEELVRSDERRISD